MSSEPTRTPPPPGDEAQDHKQARRSTREVVRIGVAVVLTILITLFAVLNLDEVKVDWVVGSGKAPLIIVIVVSVLIGIVLSYIAEHRSRKRR
ncbi:MAG: hypothetical protein ACYDC2_01225 [Solirubrobacteraceae bacterium]